MKSLIILAVTLAVAYGQFLGFQGSQGFQNQNRRPTGSPSPFAFKSPAKPFNQFQTQPKPIVPYSPQEYRPVAPRSGVDARNAAILKQGSDLSPDGTYSYFYETENGIAAQEEGTPKNFGGNPPVVPDVARGTFSWTSPEGQLISVSYVADENGYQPSGNALPTPPPIPAAIQRSLDYIARTAKASRR